MKKQLPLPESEINYLDSLATTNIPAFHARLRLLWLEGWSLSILAESVSPQRPRATIHYWVRNVDIDIPATPDAPQLPTPQYPQPTTLAAALKQDNPDITQASIKPSIPDDMKATLKTLSLQARRYRARTTQDNKFAVANREFTVLIKALKNQGISPTDIAEAAGISYRAVARRIAK